MLTRVLWLAAALVSIMSSLTAAVDPSFTAKLSIKQREGGLFDRRGAVKFTAKGDSIDKGAGGDPCLLDGSVVVTWLTGEFPAHQRTIDGGFLCWSSNTDTNAKYKRVQSSVPTNEVYKMVVKVGKALRALLKNSGSGSGAALDPGNEPIDVTYRIENGNDASVHETCVRFHASLGSDIKFVVREGPFWIDYKLIASRGVEVECPASPGGAFIDPNARR